MSLSTSKKKQIPKPKAEKKSSFSATEYLKQTPLEQDVREHDGALHIPILNLENSLDFLRWGTRNFTWQLYNNAQRKLGVSASLELLLSYTDENGEKVVDRSFVGACNFLIQSVPFEDWLATAKSLCIKNAASDAGKKLGRGLNADVVPARESNSEKSNAAETPKRKPDKDMREIIKAAKERGDISALQVWANIYDINLEDNGNETI